MENENKQPEQEELNDEQVLECRRRCHSVTTVFTTTTVVSRGMTDLQPNYIQAFSQCMMMDWYW